MAKRYRALKAISYPAPGSSLATVKRAGGLSKLTPEERAKVTIIHRKPGSEPFDDVPASSLPWLLEDNAIEEVDAAAHGFDEIVAGRHGFEVQPGKTERVDIGPKLEDE